MTYANYVRYKWDTRVLKQIFACNILKS
jgi:hypothetical protein